jgi:hypothetical protein
MSPSRSNPEVTDASIDPRAGLEAIADVGREAAQQDVTALAVAQAEQEAAESVPSEPATALTGLAPVKKNLNKRPQRAAAAGQPGRAAAKAVSASGRESEENRVPPRRRQNRPQPVQITEFSAVARTIVAGQVRVINPRFPERETYKLAVPLFEKHEDALGRRISALIRKQSR